MDRSFLTELDYKEHKTLESSIPMTYIDSEGIVGSINGVYAKSYRLTDINYIANDLKGKRELLNRYKEMLNSLDNKTDFQWTIITRKLSTEYLNNEVYYKKTGDRDDDLKESLNDVIRKNTVEGKGAYTRDKIVTVSCKERTLEKAKKEIEVIDDIIKNGFNDIGNAKIDDITGEEMLRLLYTIYNRGEVDNFLKKRRIGKDEINLYTIENAIEQGLSVKEMIIPKSLTIKDKSIKLGNKVVRALYLVGVNKIIDTLTINKITDVDFNIVLSMKVRQVGDKASNDIVKNELGSVDGMVYDYQSKLAEKGVGIELIPRSIKQRKEEIETAHDSLKIKDERFYEMSMYCLIFGDNDKELNENTEKFVKTAKRKGLSFKVGEKMQENIFNSCLFYGVNQTSFVRLIDTEGLCGFIPFGAQDIMQRGGSFFGKNIITGNPIMYDIMSGDNYSSLILGASGKGKSFKAKELILGRRMRDKDRETIIIDPNDEWGDLVKKLSGQEIQITSGGENHINLFDIDNAYGDNPIADKEDFIISICALMIHKENGVTSGQRTTISKAVSKIYETWEKTREDEDIPTIKEFVDAIREIYEEEKSEEDYELLKGLLYYSSDSKCSLFRGKSDIDINKSIVSYNLKNLGKDLKPLAMEIICDNIWTRICKNRYLRIPTDVVIDECHLMFSNNETASWMAKFWKMLRKYLGCPVGITQNPEDVLSTEAGRNVISNTVLSIMLSLLEKDRRLAKEQFNLTGEQENFIKNRQSGEGIIVIQASRNLTHDVIVPFKNPYDKNNLIYKLVNTTYTRE